MNGMMQLMTTMSTQMHTTMPIYMHTTRRRKTHCQTILENTFSKTIFHKEVDEFLKRK